jgi:outer membrane immunogenic protein
MRLALSTVALVACTSLASAADLGGPYQYEGSIKDGPYVAAPFNWTGFYVGANAGYAWGSYESFLPEDTDDDVHYVPPGGIRTDLSPDGWFGGGQIGFNLQRGSLVFGVEADWQGGDMEDSSSTTFEHTLLNNLEFDLRTNLRVESFGTVRGRLGLAMDRFLPYVTGGFAWAATDAKSMLSYAPAPATTWTASDSALHTGWVVGGGIEVALTDNLSAKAEYLYMDLGEETYTTAYVNGVGEPGDIYKTDADLEIQTFRLGVNYKFGH